MHKKIFATVLFSIVLNLVSTSQTYSMEKTENTSMNQTDSSKVSLENIYYKDKPWDFVENKLITKEGWPKKLAIPADCGIFILSSFCSGFIVWMMLRLLAKERINFDMGQFVSLSYGFPIDIFPRERTRFDKEQLIKFVALISGLTVGVITAVIFHKYITSPSTRDVIRSEDVISILQSYDPDLSKSNPNNTKLYIPKELHAIFDALYDVYKKQGEDVFKAEWNKIALLIRKQIISKKSNLGVSGAVNK